ncbi:MAG: DUF58 domain-containing protein [Bacteroidetes bacterium]|nr:DUF58 domain-containing protein [Bacteroidota bacterium]
MLLEEVQQYQNLELLAKQVVEGFITGMHRSPFHGFSVEFAEHRPYNPGESTRNIDWKLYARTDRIYTKRFEEETNLRCRIVLDLSGSMFFPANNLAKVKFSVLSAASICHLLQKQRDAFGLTTFSDSIKQQTPTRSSRAHLQEILNTLQPLWDLKKAPVQTEKTQIAQSLEQIALRQHRRSLIVIFSDMFENHMDDTAIWQAIQHLKYAKNEIIIFHVQHAPQELHFDFDNRPTRFIDTESSEQILLNPAEIKTAYLQQITVIDKRIKDRCLQYSIDLYTIDASQDFGQVLLPFYLKRMKMA